MESRNREDILDAPNFVVVTNRYAFEYKKRLTDIFLCDHLQSGITKRYIFFNISFLGGLVLCKMADFLIKFC